MTPSILNYCTDSDIISIRFGFGVMIEQPMSKYRSAMTAVFLNPFSVILTSNLFSRVIITIFAGFSKFVKFLGQLNIFHIIFLIYILMILRSKQLPLHQHIDPRDWKQPVPDEHLSFIIKSTIYPLACFLQVKIPHFCKNFSPGTSGEFLCKLALHHPSFLPQNIMLVFLFCQ